MNLKAVLLFVAFASFGVSCSKQTQPTAGNPPTNQQISLLEQFYAFAVPSIRDDLKTEQWAYSSASEGSQTTITLLRFTTDEKGIAGFVNSFSNRVEVLSGFKPVKIKDLSTKVAWWVPHEFESTDFFHLSRESGSLSGSLDAYIVTTATNKVVFLSNFLVKD